MGRRVGQGLKRLCIMQKKHSSKEASMMGESKHEPGELSQQTPEPSLPWEPIREAGSRVFQVSR